MSGWIKWEGGECPVAPETEVACRYRDGCFGVAKAREFFWNNRSNDSDIVEYYVLDDKPQQLDIVQTAKEILLAAITSSNGKIFSGEVAEFAVHTAHELNDALNNYKKEENE